jgi:hypothetical protein
MSILLHQQSEVDFPAGTRKEVRSQLRPIALMREAKSNDAFNRSSTVNEINQSKWADISNQVGIHQTPDNWQDTAYSINRCTTAASGILGDNGLRCASRTFRRHGEKSLEVSP